jgi:hypothetical protein
MAPLDTAHAPFSALLAVVRMRRRPLVERIGHYAYFADVETGLLSVLTEMVVLSDATPYGDNVRFGRNHPFWEGYPVLGRLSRSDRFGLVSKIGRKTENTESRYVFSYARGAAHLPYYIGGFFKRFRD